MSVKLICQNIDLLRYHSHTDRRWNGEKILLDFFNMEKPPTSIKIALKYTTNNIGNSIVITNKQTIIKHNSKILLNRD